MTLNYSEPTGTQVEVLERTYLSYTYSGGFLHEDSSKPSDGTNAIIALEDGEIPPEAFSFRFFKRFEAIHGEHTMRAKPHWYSKRYYPGAKAYSHAELTVMAEVNPKEYRTLAANVIDNGYDFGIKTRTGNWNAGKEGVDLIITDTSPAPRGQL